MEFDSVRDSDQQVPKQSIKFPKECQEEGWKALDTVHHLAAYDWVSNTSRRIQIRELQTVQDLGLMLFYAITVQLL